MLFIRKPGSSQAEYVLLSTIYGLNDHEEDMPLMTKREAMLAARYFLATVDDLDATAQVVNVNSKKIYTIERMSDQSNVYVATWLNGNC